MSKTRFIDTLIEKSKTSSEIKTYKSKFYDGIECAFFTRKGGVSKDIYKNDKLVGAYAGLNVGLAGNDDKSSIMKNISLAANYFGVFCEKIFILDSTYNSNVLSINKSTVGISSELGIKILKGDALITDVPEITLGVVSGDAYPVVVKAMSKENKPVVSLVVGSYHNLFKGILTKIIKMMIEEFNVDINLIEFEIGAGPGPSSISGGNINEKIYSLTTYELGKELVLNFIENSYNEGEKSYNQFHFFNKKNIIDQEHLSNEIKPVFAKHPFDNKKILFNLEAFVKQVAYNHKLNIEKVSAINKDSYKETEEFYCARRIRNKLDLDEIAIQHNTSKDKLTTFQIYSHIGRTLTLARVLK